jgi:hypothetical protein
VFITIVPFTGSSGSGTAMDSIHLRGSYLTYTASKTATYNATGWHDLSDPANYGHVGYYDPSTNLYNGPANSVGDAYMGMYLLISGGTAGVTLTQCTIDIQWATGLGTGTGGTCWIERITVGSTSSTIIGTGSVGHTGFQTANIGLSENTFGNGYQVVGRVTNSSSGIGGGTVSLTYTMNDPKQTL